MNCKISLQNERCGTQSGRMITERLIEHLCRARMVISLVSLCLIKIDYGSVCFNLNYGYIGKFPAVD